MKSKQGYDAKEDLAVYGKVIKGLIVRNERVLDVKKNISNSAFQETAQSDKRWLFDADMMQGNGLSSLFMDGPYLPTTREFPCLAQFRLRDPHTEHY